VSKSDERKREITHRCPNGEARKCELQHNNEILLDQMNQLISTNTKLIADQRVCQSSVRCWQPAAEEMWPKIDCMAFENQRLYSVDQELIEETKLLTIDRQHLQAVHEQFDLAIARLHRYTDQLEMAKQRRTDHGPTVHSLMEKLSSSRKATERLTARFNLTLGQQNEQIEKLRASLSQAYSYAPSSFCQPGDETCRPWKIIFSQKRRYGDERAHFCHRFSCYSCTGYGFLRSRLVSFPILQTIRRYFGSRLKDDEDKLTKLKNLPAFLDRLAESHPLLNSGCVLLLTQSLIPIHS
jgi:hypothetical protein